MKNHIDLKEKLLSISQGLIVVHAFPDFDAIGSALALQIQLNNQGVPADVFVTDHLNTQYKILPTIEGICKQLPDKRYDSLIVLDCSTIERISGFSYLSHIIEDINIINIDHHKDNTLFGDYQCVEVISSVGELLVALFEAFNWSINKAIATCLYAAICYDTGRFAYSNVSYQTFQRAATLIEMGVDSYQIYETLYENKTQKSFELLKIALDRLVVIENKNIAYTSIPFDSPKAHFKLIDFIRELKEVTVVLVFQEVKKEEVKVNIRSKNHFDVSSFAKIFGGGGHAKAAGFVKKGPLAMIIDDVLGVLNESNT